MSIEHSTKKIYTLSEMGVWARRVMGDWERRFREGEIAYGRRLYKSGAVVELELDGDEARVRARIDDASPYCVIEFSGGGLHWRGSTSDEFVSAAIAAAGLYEIEELAADYLVSEAGAAPEAPERPLSEEEGGERPAGGAAEPGAAPGSGSGSGAEALSDTGVRESAGEEKSRASRDGGRPAAEGGQAVLAERPAMELCLNFSSERRGLKLRAKWRDARGKEFSAYGKNCVPLSELEPREAESLIRLANMARKAGFKYENRAYFLSEILKIPNFLKNQLPEWERHFCVRKDKNVDLLALGERVVQLRPDARGVAGSASDFDVRWSPRVGDMEMDAEDFRKMLGGASSVGIVPRYGIVKVSMKDASFVRGVEEAREFGFERGMIPRYMLLALSDFGSRMEMSDELSAWMESLLADDSGDGFAEAPFLRAYQRRGAAWALKLYRHGCNALIADEMGLGKTVQALTIINRCRTCEGGGKFLVVCPASVIPVWISETKKFYPDIACGVLGAHSRLDSADLWIASYNQLRRNRNLLADAQFELAVLDEAQFIKNPDAKTTVACSSINARRRLALTGTPVENRLMDMWSVFRWLMPGLLGTRRNFEALLAADSSSDMVKSVRRQISPFVLRRMKSEVASELPEKIYVDLACPMTPLQQAEYDAILGRTRECLSQMSANSGSRITVLSLLTRLRQAACDAALLPWVEADGRESSGKIAVMLDKVEELFQSGKKILIFSQFTKFIDLIRSAVSARVGGENIFELTGSTRDRAKPVGDFQSRKGSALMLVSLRAGGTGITLTSADYVFIADPWWNPAVEEQAIDRVHRIGRRGDVFVYRLVAQDSVEQRVRALQGKKRMLFEDLLGGLKDVSANSKFAETIRDILG